jgi:hypothetical protein
MRDSRQCQCQNASQAAPVSRFDGLPPGNSRVSANVHELFGLGALKESE